MKDELLYEQIIKGIRRKIETDDFLPGDKAPSIAVIRKEFNVSSVTAVRALKELTASGYLQKLPGRGYFVAEINGRIKKNRCVGCLLRSNYVSLSDHYFNEIIAGVEQAASLAKVNLIMTPLSTPLCNQQANLEQELIDSALDMNDQASGFLIDERISDSTVKEIMMKTGKPVVILNRTSTLPVFSVSPDYRASLLKLVETLLRMQYTRFIFARSGMDQFGQRMKNAAFDEIIKTYRLERKQFRFLDRFAVVPFEETYRTLLRLRTELSGGKLALIATGDGIARELVDRLTCDGISIPGDIGIAASDGMSVTVLKKPEISTLKIDTVGMGVTAMNLLMGEINKCNSEPPQNRLIMPNLVFGETI